MAQRPELGHMLIEECYELIGSDECHGKDL